MLPSIEREIAGRKTKLLINADASKNYTKPLKELKCVVAVNKLFNVKTIHGFNKIDKKCETIYFYTNATFFIAELDNV